MANTLFTILLHLNQRCGAEIFCFRLRVRLHIGPLFRLQLQPFTVLPLKVFYNSSTIPMDVEISFSLSSKLSAVNIY